MSGVKPVSGDSPGRILRSAREALGLSRREIAEALNLLESTVTAIEDDDTARQPEPVFMRGYVRNYAKLLRLDPEPLVAALVNDRRLLEPAPSPKSAASNRWLWPVAGAFAALVMLISVVFYLLGTPPSGMEGVDSPIAGTPHLEKPETSEAEEGIDEPDSAVNSVTPVSSPDAPMETGLPLTQTEAAAPFVEVQDDVGEPSGTSEPPGDAVVEVEADGAIDSVATEIVPAMAETVKSRRLNPGGTDRIHLEFTADCWVRVKDTAGKMLFSDMGRKGGSMELVGEGPFDLLLGNAPGAALKWNDQPIELRPFMRNNVASLKLGEAAPLDE